MLIHRPMHFRQFVTTPMTDQHFPTYARRPRHRVHDQITFEVTAELASRDPVTECKAQLVDLSRQGLQIAITQPLLRNEHVRIHIGKDGDKSCLTLDGQVRWQRTEKPGHWSVGCEFASPLPYEVMGELFLNGILDMDAAN